MSSEQTAVTQRLAGLGKEELIGGLQLQGSRGIARATLAAALISAPFILIVAVRFNASLGLRLAALTASVIVYEGVVLRGIVGGRHRPWLDWVSAAVEVSVPSVVSLFDAHHLGPAYALTTAIPLLYGPAIMASALRLRPALVLFAGLFAAAQQMGLILLLHHRLDPALVQVSPALSFSQLSQRATYVALAGLIAYLICRALRRLITTVIATSARERRARDALGLQVTEPVAKLLLESDAWTAGAKRSISVLFLDIRSFTRFSETRDPAEVVGFLNDFFEAMCDVVARHGGTVNKFLGDGLMAIFGAPLSDPDHALNAARAALEMAAQAPTLARRAGLPALDVGIGVHTGEAVCGLMGSSRRAEYTAIGDAVNLASRIEGLNKEYGTHVLVSGSTVDALGPRARTRRVAEASVKGRAKSVVVHELLEVQADPAAPPLADARENSGLLGG